LILRIFIFSRFGTEFAFNKLSTRRYQLRTITTIFISLSLFISTLVLATCGGIHKNEQSRQELITALDSNPCRVANQETVDSEVELNHCVRKCDQSFSTCATNANQPIDQNSGYVMACVLQNQACRQDCQTDSQTVLGFRMECDHEALFQVIECLEQIGQDKEAIKECRQMAMLACNLAELDPDLI
jgi:hypothetical protein